MSAKFTIKNHISQKAKRVSSMMKGKFGLNLTDLDNALKGDKQALKAIGEAARQGKQIQELMPLLEDAYLNLIRGTETYNKGVSNILKQGASSAINIDKAVGQASLANVKYNNQRKEIKADYIATGKAEHLRHQYAVNYIQLKSYIDSYMSTVDGDAKLLEQTYRPEIRQIEEDKRYELNAAKHLLQNGSEARLDLLPARDYIPDSSAPATPKTQQSRGMMESLEKIVQALGFSTPKSLS